MPSPWFPMVVSSRSGRWCHACKQTPRRFYKSVTILLTSENPLALNYEVKKSLPLFWIKFWDRLYTSPLISVTILLTSENILTSPYRWLPMNLAHGNREDDVGFFWLFLFKDLPSIRNIDISGVFLREFLDTFWREKAHLDVCLHAWRHLPLLLETTIGNPISVGCKDGPRQQGR